MNKKRGIPCIVLGIVISVFGIFPIVSGIIIDNSDILYNYQLDNYYRSGTFVNIPKILLIAGAVTIFIGLMLMILGIILHSSSDSRNNAAMPAANNNRNNSAFASNKPSNQCAVIDEVNSLTEYQKIGLLSRLENFKSKTNYGIAIYIKRDDFSEELFKSAYDFYKTKVLGQSCVILMLSAANNKMFISTMGNCRKLMNDADKERIYNILRNHIFIGQYYDAGIEFIDSTLDCVIGADMQNTAPKYDSFVNTNTVVAQPSDTKETAQTRDIDNINPYADEGVTEDVTPTHSVEPTAEESYIPSRRENVYAEAQDDVQVNAYENPEPVNADSQSLFHNNFCTACGAAIKKDDKFCPQCGNKLI